jgi:hypothetical protein
MTDVLRAVERLLRLHGAVLTERSRVTFDRRPGVFVLSEANIDAGEHLVLVVHADGREPGTFGPRLDAEA